MNLFYLQILNLIINHKYLLCVFYELGSGLCIIIFKALCMCIILNANLILRKEQSLRNFKCS